MEAFRLSRGAPIVETQSGLHTMSDVQVGHTLIPTRRTGDGRLMRIRYVPPPMTIPKVSLQRLRENPSLAAQFAGKVVFVGVTGVGEVRDTQYTPYAYGQTTTGIEINANAFETLAQGRFITDLGDQWVLLFSLLLVVAAGLSFRYLPGWWAYAGGVPCC